MAGLNDLDPLTVLRAYAMGVFPMADHRDAESVYWVEPKYRGVLPLDRFHLSRSLRKTVARGRFHVTADQAFSEVITLCAESARDRPDTWINDPIERVFNQLHDIGFAHSVECWEGEELVGGLYGLSLGRAFFGESMVSRRTDASKTALAWLVARLNVGGYTLLDCQFITDHLASLGATEIPRSAYQALLEQALEGSSFGSDPNGTAQTGDFYRLDQLLLDQGAVAADGGIFISQLLGQTS